MTGIPFARYNVETGERECPVCHAIIPADRTDEYGESLTNNYGVHYSENHWAMSEDDPRGNPELARRLAE